MAFQKENRPTLNPNNMARCKFCGKSIDTDYDRRHHKCSEMESRSSEDVSNFIIGATIVSSFMDDSSSSTPFDSSSSDSSSSSDFSGGGGDFGGGGSSGDW